MAFENNSYLSEIYIEMLFLFMYGVSIFNREYMSYQWEKQNSSINGGRKKWL